MDPIRVRADPLTAAEIATQKVMFNETKRWYNKCQSVEVALRNQISEVIKDDYLQPLRNSTTDIINNIIPEIFTFLTNTYGQLSPSQLKERERVIDDMIYDPSQNNDIVFNKITESQDLCILLQDARLDTQLVVYAYLCFQKQAYSSQV